MEKGIGLPLRRITLSVFGEQPMEDEGEEDRSARRQVQ